MFESIARTGSLLPTILTPAPATSETAARRWTSGRPTARARLESDYHFKYVRDPVRGTVTL